MHYTSDISMSQLLFLWNRIAGNPLLVYFGTGWSPTASKVCFRVLRVWGQPLLYDGNGWEEPVAEEAVPSATIDCSKESGSL